MTGRELPPHIVLDELQVHDHSVRLVAWRDAGSDLWIGITGARPFTGAIGCHTGSVDDAAVWTSSSSPSATVLWGYLDPAVARFEIRGVDGGVGPARIHHSHARCRTSIARSGGRPPATPSIGSDRLCGRRRSCRSTTTTTIMGFRPYPIGPVEAASGEHRLGRWWAHVTPTTRGVMFDVTLEGHGGGGDGLVPMAGSQISVGFSWGGSANVIQGQASSRFARIEHHLDDGRRVEAIVFDLPGPSVDFGRGHVAFADGGERISGETVGYDSAGDEIARIAWGRDVDEPPNGSASSSSDAVRF